ncbi:S8 family serine peptidase, partial [Thermococcus sp.]
MKSQKGGIPMDKRTQLIIGVALSVFVVLSVFGYTPVFSSNIQEEVVLVPINSPDEVQLLTAQGFRIIEQYDAYVLAYAPVNTINAVNLGGMTIPVEKIDYSLGFAAGKLSPESLEEYKITGDTVNPGLYVVQLIGPAKPEWIDFLKNSGVILAYIPNYGYLVKVSSPIQIPEVSFIRGIYEYQPEWKEGMGLSKKLSEILSGKDNSTKLRISVILDPTVSDPVAVAEDLANKYGIELEKHPGRIGSIIIDTHGALRYKFIGTIDVKNIPSLLQDPRVVIVDYAPEIKIFNSVAARVTRVYLARDEMLNGLKVNLTGAGQVVAIADTGLDTGDPNTVVPDFAGRVLTIYDAAGDGDPSDPNDANLGGHGTHVAGSVAGSGVMSGSDPNNHKYDGSFAGMAPEAQIHFESIGSTGGLTGAGLNYDSITNMATRAYNDGARIWTNSWGSSSNSYDSSAQEVDQFMWDHKDFLILFAAGNSGPGANTVGSPATAKDIITVGASENLDPNLAGNGLSEYGMADNPDQLAYFSSRGPTADNRIKPDIVAPGSGIVSVRASTVSDSNVGATWIIPIDSNGDGKFDYIAMQGTSMATPVAAGTMVLIRQYFTDYEGITPSAALLKATAIVGTDILPGYVFGGYDQGWGRLNIAGSLFPKPPMAFKYWDWQTVDNGGVWQQTINVVNSSVPLRIVLVWTDYPGSQNANPALVNDLDLVVIAPDGTEYHGNIFDNTTATSIANTTDYDRLNPVEVVRVTNPKTGTWTIKVIGHNIAQDDPDGSGSLDQTFALTVRGGIGPQKPENTKLLRERFDGDGWTYDEGRIQLTPGEEKKFRIRLFNWGTSTQSYTLGYSSDTSDITVSLSQTSVTLDPGKYVEIIASVKAAPSLTPGLYTLRIYAKDSNGYAQALQFKVALMHPVPFPIERITRTQENLTAETTSSLAIDPTDGSLWVAYFRQETDRQGNSYTDARLGKGDNFDLIVAHSTDGGMTWTEYVALHDFDRYFDYNGNDEQIIDWFYWFPQMDVDDNGKIYVAFSTAESVYVVYGDENGFDNQKFDTGSVSSSLFGTTVKLVYPWASVATFGAGKAMVVYSYYDSSSSTRHLKYVYTTDGGQNWNGPDYINSGSNLVEYAPYAVSYGGQVLAFFVGRDSSTSDPLALYYYVFDGSSWSGPTEVYSGSGSVFYPSAFVD